MQSSLSWIEWLDRLDRVLEAVRKDLKSLKQLATPEAFATVELGKRQLSALSSELRLLDRSVLCSKNGAAPSDRADNLKRALDTTVFQLEKMSHVSAAAPFIARERLVAAIDSSLRDSAREATLLLGPSPLSA